jgi:hypothetical protein
MEDSKLNEDDIEFEEKLRDKVSLPIAAIGFLIFITPIFPSMIRLCVGIGLICIAGIIYSLWTGSLIDARDFIEYVKNMKD